MDTSIQASIASMRRNIERVYKLPPELKQKSDEFFARLDEQNAAERLEQDALDELFFEFVSFNRFSAYTRKESDPDYILYR